MLPLKVFQSAFALLVIATALGCGDRGGVGQSGSEFIPPPSIGPGAPPIPHCPCDAFRQWQPIRAAVVDIQTFPTVSEKRYELVAKEVLGPDPLGTSSVVAAAHFGGYWSGSLGCEGMSKVTFKPGDEVLAFYRRGTQDTTACCENFACDSECYREIGQTNSDRTPLDNCRADCVSSTKAACAQHGAEAGLRGELMLMPWADELVVGASDEATVSIRRDQLGALTEERAMCVAEIADLRNALHPSLFGQDAGAHAPAPNVDAGKQTNGVATPPPAPSNAAARDTPPADAGGQVGSTAASPPAPSNPPGQASEADAGVQTGQAGPPCCKDPGPIAGGGAQPANGAGTNGTNPTLSQADAPPPAGPEDPRVRCANP